MELASPRVAKRSPTDVIGPRKKARFDTGSDLDESVMESTRTAPQSVASTTRSKSSRPKKYICTFSDCGKTFDRPVKLEAHERTHTNDRPFICEEDGCSKAFFKAEHLKAHVQNKHSDEANHICRYIVKINEEGEIFECGKAFTTATRLRRHVAFHETSELKCDMLGCGQVFRKLETLQRHIKKDHLQENAFRCDEAVDNDEICGQTFPSAGQLRTHRNREHKPLKYICSKCSPPGIEEEDGMLLVVGFPTYNDLQNHNKAVHPPTCNLCNEPFPSDKALAAHMEIEHASLASRQKFICEYPGCERGFTRQGNLKIHIQNVHVKVKKYICGEYDLSKNEKCPGWERERHSCGIGFATKASLENHVRTQHLDLSTMRKRRHQIEVKSEPITPESAMELDEPPEMESMFRVGNHCSTPDGSANIETCPLVCWTGLCRDRFSDEFHLGQHMELVHGWSVDDINDRFEEEAALNEEHFWIGGEGPPEAEAHNENREQVWSRGADDHNMSAKAWAEAIPIAMQRMYGTNMTLASAEMPQKGMSDIDMMSVEYGGDNTDFAVDPALVGM